MDVGTEGSGARAVGSGADAGKRRIGTWQGRGRGARRGGGGGGGGGSG